MTLLTNSPDRAEMRKYADSAFFKWSRRLLIGLLFGVLSPSAR